MMASKATPGIPSRYEWVQETYEQLTLCKYDGRPHTGKNWDRTFTNPRCVCAFDVLLQHALLLPAQQHCPLKLLA
jgi:hypothetical protein